MRTIYFMLGFIAGLILAIIIIFSGTKSWYYDTWSKKPIIPDLTIKVKNGIADTTYWYKR